MHKAARGQGGYSMDEAQELHWKEFGRHLERLIRQADLSVTEFAQRAHITLTQASRILNGQSGTRRSTLPRFVEALNLSKKQADELYSKAGFTTPPEFQSITVVGPDGKVVEERTLTEEQKQKLKAAADLIHSILGL